MQKCSHLWSKINRPKTSEQIVTTLGSQLKYPVVTRWNSLYDSVKDIIKHKGKINEVCRMLEMQTFLQTDLDYLEDYLLLLKPIAEALDFLQRERGMIYGYLLPTLATIRTKYRKMMLNSPLKVFPLQTVSMLEEFLVKRFPHHFNLTREVNDAIVASVLCPSVKLRWISALNPSFNDCKISEISCSVRKIIQAEENATLDSPEKNCQKKSHETSFFDFSIQGILLYLHTYSIICNEFQTYFQIVCQMSH